MEYIKFQNGLKIPKVGLGLGIWKNDDRDIEPAIDAALEAGYRHFDTAFMYRTEEVLGKCIQKWIGNGMGKREDLFITTKLPWNGNSPHLVEHFINLSLKTMNLAYVDLYLIHWPIGVKYSSDREFLPKDSNGDIDIDPGTDLEALWKAMEYQVDSGKIKSIGVSNFNASQIERVLKVARIPPSNTQFEAHAYFPQKELISFCSQNDLSVCAYSPLGSPWMKGHESIFGLLEAVNLLEDPIVVTMATKHGKDPGQILLRYLLQLGTAVIPRSYNPLRLAKNIDIFNFALSSGDMELLGGLDKGKAGRSFPTLKILEHHPEAPF